MAIKNSAFYHLLSEDLLAAFEFFVLNPLSICHAEV